MSFYEPPNNNGCFIVIKHSISRLSFSIALTFIAFVSAKITSVIPKIFRNRKKNETKIVAIEAGKLGMKSVFYEELVDSAKEFYGTNKVIEFTINREKSYLKQSYRNIRVYKPNLLIVDPRTGSQFWPRAYLQTMIILIFSRVFNFTPIVILTDASILLWRIQAIMLTANRKSKGVIVTFLDYKKFKFLFPHSRIIGPSLIPISKQRIAQIEIMSKSNIRKSITNKSYIHFLGSLYNKRKIFFDEMNILLGESTAETTILMSKKDKFPSSNEYWNFLVENPISITTTFIEKNPKYYYDRSDINQLVFRISEALAVGNFLFCQFFPGISEIFTDGKEMCIYYNKEDLLKKIVYYFENQEEMVSVSKTGNEFYKELARKNFFWTEIELYVS